MKDERFAKIPAEDIDDVIGRAARLMQEDEALLERAEVVAVGRDLDIPEEILDRAWTSLQEERALVLRETEQRRAARNKMAMVGAGVGGALVLLGVFWLHGLSSTYAELEAARSQVQNVVNRQKAVQARWREEPSSPDKMAALDGADNRIRVESQRYAKAAAVYNAKASSFPYSLLLRFSSMPAKAPMLP